MNHPAFKGYCKDCFYYEPSNKYYGICRHGPPTNHNEMSESVGILPEMRIDDWYAQFQPKEKEND